MSLTNDLQAHAERSTAAASPETVAQRNDAREKLAALTQTRPVIAVGDVAPDFSLPDAAGSSVHLSKLLTTGPVVVSFYRGGWCPYCNIELRALQTALPALTAAGATLVAISLDAPDDSLSTAEKSDLQFPVLSDTRAAAITAYGLNYTIESVSRAVLSDEEAERAGARGVETQVLPTPATYVIGSDGRVAYAFVDHDYTHRAEPTEIVAAVSALTGKS